MPATTHALEDRLAAALGRRRRRRHGWRATAAAGALLFAAVWAAAQASNFGELTIARLALPEWADEALDAHDTAVGPNLDFRRLAASDPERLTEALARSVTHLLPPHLHTQDSTLAIVGAQIVPWDGGSAMHVHYRTADGRPVTMFIAAVEGPDEPEPTVATFGRLSLVYWRNDNYAYALSG